MGREKKPSIMVLLLFLVGVSFVQADEQPTTRNIEEALGLFLAGEKVKENDISDVAAVMSEQHAKLPNDISFFAVDCKFSADGALKILEFQDGATAGLRAYDQVFGAKGQIWRNFWAHINKFNIPVWYVGPRPRIVSGSQFSHHDAERIAFDDFLAMGGRYAAHLNDLPKDPVFKERMTKRRLEDEAQGEEVRSVTRKGIEDATGIILMKYCGTQAYVEEFKRKYPNFLVVSERSRRHMVDKVKEDRLFKRWGLSQYRPWCKVVSKAYQPSLASKMIRQSRANYFVIKPLNSSRSNGVLVVKKELLNRTFIKLFKNKSIPTRLVYGKPYKPSSPQTFDYWKHDDNSSFLLEEYVPSKTIMVSGKPYDPTLRVVVAMQSNKGQVSMEFLGGFWKVPPKALDEKSSLTQQHVSKFHENMQNLSAQDLAFSSEDEAEIYRILKGVLTRVYLNILAR